MAGAERSNGYSAKVNSRWPGEVGSRRARRTPPHDPVGARRRAGSTYGGNVAQAQALLDQTQGGASAWPQRGRPSLPDGWPPRSQRASLPSPTRPRRRLCFWMRSPFWHQRQTEATDPLGSTMIASSTPGSNSSSASASQQRPSHPGPGGEATRHAPSARLAFTEQGGRPVGSAVCTSDGRFAHATAPRRPTIG